MQGISQDTVLAGRYALQTRLAAHERLEHWSARDRTLDREVAITIFATGDPRADAALDSARRAAGIEDARLVRILDVGRQGEHAYIVEEGLHEATSLTELLGNGTLPPEEVRRIVGEAATALEIARARGLHHLRLTPHAILRTKEGGVRVSGLAVAAALDGADELPSTEASRADAVGLVALLYAGLTGTWPLEPAVSGMESAHRLAGGGVREPADVPGDRGSSRGVAEVPADLNTLCRLTLRGARGDDADGGGEDGPRTPGELARQLAPWAVEQVRGTTRSAGWAAASTAVGLGTPTDGDAGAGGGDDSNDESLASWQAGSREGDNAEIPADGASRNSRADRDDDRLESPVPMLPGRVVAEPSGDQAKIALALVAAFVVVAVLLAYNSKPFGNHGSPAAGGTSQHTTRATTTTPTASPSSTHTPSPSKTSKKPTKPIKIESAGLLNPAENSIENPDTVHWTVDGSASTKWQSWGTLKDSFNGKKEGVGLVFDLGRSRTVTEATLDLPLPNDLTVYVSDSKDRDGATKLGTSAGESGTVTIKASDPAPRGQYVIVWFTSLVRDSTHYHASLAEISLK